MKDDAKEYREGRFMRSKRFHNWNTPHCLFLFSSYALSLFLSLSHYLLYLEAQREKLCGGKLLSSCSCISELISVLDRREFFQVLKVFSFSIIAYLFREKEGRRESERQRGGSGEGEERGRVKRWIVCHEIHPFQ